MSSDSKNIRSAILDAALDLFSEHGFHSSPISQIATLAGVGVGSIYRYFSDKDALIHAVYAKVDGPLQCLMDKNIITTFSPHLQFTHFVTDLIYHLRSHPKDFRFIEQYYNSSYGINKVHAKIFQDNGSPSDLFTRLFLSGQKESTIRSLPLPVYLTMTFGPITYLVRYSLSGHITVDDAIVQATADACWNAIKA
ncbi:MAG: TetR/AcrR family transcriptional regulator [Desulfoplanes sp.]|nr:TetR/AcrR family transcriptional regulator [Desulfoplanes sp.]